MTLHRECFFRTLRARCLPCRLASDWYSALTTPANSMESSNSSSSSGDGGSSGGSLSSSSPFATASNLDDIDIHLDPPPPYDLPSAPSPAPFSPPLSSSTAPAMLSFPYKPQLPSCSELVHTPRSGSPANEGDAAAGSSSAESTPKGPHAVPVPLFTPEQEAELCQQAAKHKLSGNQLFSKRLYHPAIDAYKLALEHTPIYLTHDVAILHSNIAACYLKANDAEGALKHAQLAVEGRPGWIKARLRRERAREVCGGWKELEETLEEMRALLDGRVHLEEEMTAEERREVEAAARRCESVVEEQKKKEMADVMCGLKTFGDGILRPFGLSTNDFGVVKDERTGQYSMTFQRGGAKVEK